MDVLVYLLFYVLDKSPLSSTLLAFFLLSKPYELSSTTTKPFILPLSLGALTECYFLPEIYCLLVHLSVILFLPRLVFHTPVLLRFPSWNKRFLAVLHILTDFLSNYPISLQTLYLYVSGTHDYPLEILLSFYIHISDHSLAYTYLEFCALYNWVLLFILYFKRNFF